MKSKFLDIYKRWRHTLGYGVHSPLAYRIITDCINPDSGYAYYADFKIEDAFAKDYAKRQQLMLALRLIHIFRPACVLMPDANKTERKIISETFPKLRIIADTRQFKTADFIVFFGKKAFDGNWQNFLPPGEWTILAFDPNRDLAEHTDASLLLRSRRFTLSLKRDGMKRVEYDIL